MAEFNTSEQILLEVQLQATEALTRMGELKDQIGQLKSAQEELDTTTVNGQREYDKLASQIRVLNKEMRDHQNTVDKANSMAKSYGDSMQEMKRKVSDLTKEFNNLSKEQREGALGKELQKQIRATHDELVKAEESLGNYHREVGNYKKALEGFQSSSPFLNTMTKISQIVPTSTEAMKSMAVATKDTSKAMIKLLANPIVAFIAAIVLVVKQVVDAFKRSEDSMNTLKQAFSGLNPILDVVKRAFDAFAKVIAGAVTKAVDGLIKGVSGLMKLLDKVGGWLGKDWHLEENWNNASDAAKELTKAEQNYIKYKRQFVQDEAKAENEIAKLKDKSVQKDKYTAEERINFLTQAGEKEKEIAQKRIKLAKMELAALEAEAARGENDAETNNRLAEARANVTRAETAYFQKMKEVNSQIVAFRQEQASATNAAANEDEKKRKQDEKDAKEAQKRAKSDLDLKLAQLEAEKGENWAYTEESRKAHNQYYDDLAALYEKDSAEYNAAIQQKVKYNQAFDKKLEEMAKQREDLLAQYNLISPTKNQLNKELQNLADAHEQGILSEEQYAEAVTEIYSRIATSKAESVASYAQGIMNMVGTINSAIEQNENAQMDQYAANNEAKKEALEERLNSGLMSQEAYDAQVAILDSDLERKQKALALQQAKRQKAMAIMNATLAAAQAIIQSLALSPVAYGPIPNPAGIASLALATATGIAQIAAAAATPLPQAARGKYLTGPSHAQGGIKIEAEGGEAIINKRSTRMFKPLLSAINQAGGGVKFANGGVVDGGYATRTITNQMQLATSRDFALLGEQIAGMKIYTAVTDINDGQSNYAKVEQLREF